MTDLEKAARMALEALKQIDEAMPFPVAKFAQAALRQALEQPQDEWLTGCPECGMDGECGCDKKSEPAQQEAKQCAQCKKEYRCEKTGVGCPKCAPGLSVSEAEFREPIQAAQQEPVDWEAVAADQAMTIAMMKAEQEDAVLAEREACAQVCDDRDMGDCNREDMEARACAAAIRARGQA